MTQQLEAVGDGRPVSPHQDKQPTSFWRMEIGRRRVPRKDLMHFSRQLAVFIRAGIPILDALSTIREEVTNKTFARVLNAIIDDLRGGATFSAAARRHPEAFPAFYLGILESAELTGRLDEVLDQLSEYIDRDLDARGKVKSALIYPAVILVMSVVVVAVLVGFVLPRFEAFFDSLDVELPLATRMLLGIADFLTSYWWLLGGAALISALLMLLALRTDRGRFLRDRVLLKLPVIGDLMHHVVLERFCRILSSMMSAGVPLPDAMKVTADATSNRVFQTGLSDAREAMLRGEGLATPLSETGLFPGSAKQMFRVGEDTGTLDDQLHTAAVYFERELDYKIKRFTSLFEPAILVVVGLVVGFVAIALVSAMYGIFSESNTV
ncbi:MAG TPA: type II secretion system F family protein [Mycobacteriales bacterium]|nr:type II secretion system F family protein [Mycobacteriales bacterium]